MIVKNNNSIRWNNIENLEKFLSEYNIILFIILFIIMLPSVFYRFPGVDESYYLLETSNIASFLSDGKWIGNESVGLHGFLFKIPVALIYLISGPSIIIAALYSIILSTFCCWLFYKILKILFEREIVAFSGVVLLFTNFLFYSSASTYLREMPVLFSLLLLSILVISKKHSILLGLALMLVLDAKEHVFYQIAPGLFLWFTYTSFLGNSSMLKKMKSYFINGLLIVVPSIVYLILMFYTPIFPINMFNAYILGLIDKGLTIKNQFAPINAGKDVINTFKYLSFLKRLSDKSFYFVKLFQPGILNISIVPMFIAVPALITAIISLFHNRKNVSYSSFVYFALTMWSYFIVFFLRASHGRYLFNILPGLIIFFIYFIFKVNRAGQIAIMVLAIVFTVIGLLFEHDYIFIKTIISVFFVLMIKILILSKLDTKKMFLLFCLFFGATVLSLGVRSSFSSNIKQVRNYGYWYEARAISKEIGDYKRVGVMDLIRTYSAPPYDRLIQFYKKIPINTVEWHWRLADSVKSHMNLSEYEDETIFPIHIVGRRGVYDIEDIKAKCEETIKTEKLDALYIIMSTIPGDTYEYQDELLDYLEDMDNLVLSEVQEKKGKDLYLFSTLYK